jgi:ribosomal-protein-alanine N-acetyltransferase
MSTPGEVSIRLARADEIDAIVHLDRTLDTLPHWPAAEYRTAIAGHDPQRLRCLFVADRVSDRGSQIVGLAVGRVDHIAGEYSGELESVGVALSAQRRGIGRELCLKVIDWCQSKGASHVDLEVRSRSAGPISLYGQLGFAVAGKRRNYYRDPSDDAILMRLDLKPGWADPASQAESAP